MICKDHDKTIEVKMKFKDMKTIDIKSIHVLIYFWI